MSDQTKAEAGIADPLRALQGEIFLWEGDDSSPVDLDVLRAAADEIGRLRRDCGEAYQIVGALGSADDPAVDKALDNLHAAAEGRSRPHDDLLPFVSTPDPRDARIAELESALREVREWYDNEFAPSYDVAWAALEGILSRALGEEAGGG